MGARRRARIIAFQTLYRYDFSGEPLKELLDYSWLDTERFDRLNSETVDFASLLVTGTVQNLEAVDVAIKNQVEHWDFSRLSRVDLALLRISVYCLLFQPGIPDTVTIDEAVDIAKEFGSEDSYRFVNGVLDGIRKRRANASHTPGPE